MVAKVKPRPMKKHRRYMMVTAFLRFGMFCMPQKREVSTEAPMPIPIQQIWNKVINWFARLEAEIATSPSLPSMMVSIILTPMVMRPCMEIGIPIFATFI